MAYEYSVSPWYQKLFHHITNYHRRLICTLPDSKVHGDNMGPTWVLSAPDGPHVGPQNLAIRAVLLWWWKLMCHIMSYHEWHIDTLHVSWDGTVSTQICCIALAFQIDSLYIVHGHGDIVSSSYVVLPRSSRLIQHILWYPKWNTNTVFVMFLWCLQPIGDILYYSF